MCFLIEILVEMLRHTGWKNKCGQKPLSMSFITKLFANF